MIKKRTPRAFIMYQLLWTAESIFILVAPIYLYGWLRGLLIYSALSSLLHIAAILCGMMPRCVVVKDGKVLEDQDDIFKEAKQP